jgi:hypothetical protein|nr:MAG TPA: 43 kDa tail protein [Caudoviricetes sp.]
MVSGADVASRAKSEMEEIGGKCGNNNKYTHWYSDNIENIGYNFWWCAAFVTYVVRQCGVSTDIVPNYAYCPDCINWARNKGRLYAKSQITNGTYTPRAGDIFLREGHTGIIISVSGNQFTTIEGNTGGTSNCRTVGSHTWTYSTGNYEYVFHPDYPGQSSDSADTKSALKPQRERIIEVPGGLGKHYTYMNWNTIKNMDTLQGRLIKEAGKKYDSDGYGMVGNRYTLAMTSTFGDIGDYVDVYMSDGRVIKGILADEKSQVYTAWDHNPANKWGHDNGQCIVEWITNWKSRDNPPSNGSVVKVINLGNYFEYPEYASGDVESYMYSENSYGDSKEVTAIWNNRVKENVHPAMQNLAPVPVLNTLTLYSNGVDITKMIGDLSWKNSIYELATTMMFNVAKTDAAYLRDLMYIPQVGDIVRMVTNMEIYRGVIIKVDDGDENNNKYTVVDLGWYLNKTSQTYQFRNISASSAIREICNDLSISIAMLPELEMNINELYFDKTVADIFTDILDKCYGDYNYDFVPEGLRIYKVGNLTAYPEFRISNNTKQVYSPKFKGNVSHSLSIEEMKNSVKIISEKDSVYTELMVLQNRELINQYGFLQQIVKIDPEKESADSVAQRELHDNARAKETYSIEILEKYDSYTRAGEVIMVDDINYVIESTDHSIKNGWHFNRLQLKKLV